MSPRPILQPRLTYRITTPSDSEQSWAAPFGVSISRRLLFCLLPRRTDLQEEPSHRRGSYLCLELFSYVHPRRRGLRCSGDLRPLVHRPIAGMQRELVRTPSFVAVVRDDVGAAFSVAKTPNEFRHSG